jgi:hypothetical protein
VRALHSSSSNSSSSSSVMGLADKATPAVHH